MAGWFPKMLEKGCHHLSAPVNTVCADIGTYYKIAGTWTDGNGCNCGFEYDGSGKITYTGRGGYFLFNGVSDLSADKACSITYTLYKNGVLVPGAQTLHTFPASARTSTIAIVNIIKINSGDYFEVYVKSDTTSTTVTHNALFLTFLSDR